MRFESIMVCCATFLLSSADGHGVERCGTPDVDPKLIELESPSDCSLGNTNPTGEYAPNSIINLPIVVHVIMTSSGFGDVSNALIQSQIDVLNEDFRAIAGSLGENGDDALIQFSLASLDPSGNPTTGVTRSLNTTWFNDQGSYWNTLAWDPTRYINVYTNSASGNLGYVPRLPQTPGFPGTTEDRVVVLWSAFGRNAPYGPPYDLGRTLTHEIGHYFGLFHTFNGCGTASSPGCYSTGDRICDTAPEDSPTEGCPVGQMKCGDPDPVDNYMNYTDDLCMERFTPEQINRMRCTLKNYRGTLYPTVSVTANISAPQFLMTCPQGDNVAAKYVVTVDFEDGGFDHPILPAQLTFVEQIAGLEFFVCPGSAIVADSAATAANGFRTTITHGRMSGCATGSVQVLLDGDLLGETYYSSRSTDFYATSPGYVDAGDVATFAQTLGLCSGQSGYNQCADFVDTPTGPHCVDSSDLAFLAAHLGHSKLGGCSQNVLALTQLPNDGAHVTARNDLLAAFGIERVEGRVIEALGLVIPEYVIDEATFRRALERGTSVGSSLVANSSREAGANKPHAGATIEWARVSPNPSRGGATIDYELNRDNSQVEVDLYDVLGRHVSKLFHGRQNAGRHSVEWNRRDTDGNRASSGSYFVRFSTSDGDFIRKIVLID